jgi:hypothetical protein
MAPKPAANPDAKEGEKFALAWATELVLVVFSLAIRLISHGIEEVYLT